MWYEIIPTAAIIYASMAIPAFAMYYGDKLVLGNAYRRSQLSCDNRRMYRRDRILHDDPYIVWGLEHLPDGDPDDQVRGHHHSSHGDHHGGGGGAHAGDETRHHDDDSECTCPIADEE